MDVLKNAMAAEGIDLFGVCDFAPLQPYLLSCRAAARLPHKAQSVIVALFPYRFEETGEERNLSRYAAVNDYHTAVGAALARVGEALQAAAPTHTFSVFVDNSPIPEVRAAAMAGLGMVGAHGLLIHPHFGSYVFIGEIVTDKAFPATGHTVHTCDECGRCVASCPVKGDKARCLSALTQKKGALTAEEAALVRAGGLVWGCDTCQEACPHNTVAATRPHRVFDTYTPTLRREDLSADNLREKPYGWRGDAPLWRNFAILEGKTDG